MKFILSIIIFSSIIFAIPQTYTFEGTISILKDADSILASGGIQDGMAIKYEIIIDDEIKGKGKNSDLANVKIGSGYFGELVSGSVFEEEGKLIINGGNKLIIGSVFHGKEKFGKSSIKFNDLTITNISKPVSVPEPSTISLFIASIIGFGYLAKKRKLKK